MATYPIKHKETGETKEIVMSIHEWDNWVASNPDWERYYTPENSPSLGLEVGEWKDKLMNKHPGWKEVMKKVERSPGRNAKDLY